MDWGIPNKRKCGAFYGKGTLFLCLLFFFLSEKRGRNGTDMDNARRIFYSYRGAKLVPSLAKSPYTAIWQEK